MQILYFCCGYKNCKGLIFKRKKIYKNKNIYKQKKVIYIEKWQNKKRT